MRWSYLYTTLVQNPKYTLYTCPCITGISDLIYVFNYRLVDVENDKIRLIDDGFAKICNMVNDVSMKVRRDAASLLVCM